MRFKKTATAIHTDDPYYDIFDGGHIDPRDLLEDEDADKLRNAITLVRAFIEEGIYQDLIILS